MELNKHFDYTDNYSEIVHTTRLISAEELTDRFFCAPQWITALMKFRNAIVKPFGLKGEKNLSDFVIVESDRLATISKNNKHLDFVIAFMTEKRMNDSLYLSVCTKVRYNNRMGKFYFRFLSVRLNRLKNKLLANYLRNRGNDLATVRNSAFCVAILSNNSFICKYNIFFRKYELSVAIL